MTQPQPSQQQYSAAVADIRAKLAAYAAAAWVGLGFGDAAMKTLPELMVPKVRAGQLLIANLTSAYFARATGTPAIRVPDLVTQGRGVDPKIVYQRPVIAARVSISEGKPPEKAIHEGGLRLGSLVTTDLQMAKVRQADESLKAAGIQHYRRVPKGTSTCAMCLIASTKRYNTGNLAPIHPGCDCGVDIIPPGHDLDKVINAALLEATHQQVKAMTGVRDAGGRAVDYRKLIITHDHGEIGPVLGWEGQHFTGPSDILPVTLDA